MPLSYTFSNIDNDNLVDWESEGGFEFDSFIETGYEILENVLIEKEANTVYCFFMRTEMNVFPNEGENGVVFDQPSSCYMVAKWHFSDSETSGKWSNPQQVYRLQRFFLPDSAPAEGAPFDYGYEVIQTINQVRGKGRSLVLRFESEDDKDFHLLGWATPFTVLTAS